jgi:hypothetical protein
MRFIAFLCLFIPSAIQAQLVMSLSDSTDEIKFGQHAMYTLQEKGVLGIKEIVHLDPSIFSINEMPCCFLITILLILMFGCGLTCIIPVNVVKNYY